MGAYSSRPEPNPIIRVKLSSPCEHVPAPTTAAMSLPARQPFVETSGIVSGNKYRPVERFDLNIAVVINHSYFFVGETIKLCTVLGLERRIAQPAPCDKRKQDCRLTNCSMVFVDMVFHTSCTVMLLLGFSVWASGGVGWDGRWPGTHT